MSRSGEVDAYIAALPPGRAARVTAIRDMVHAVWPDIAERIEWKMPVFQRGDRWVAVASQKSYVSIYLRSVTVAERIAATDAKLARGKGCLNIRDAAPLPIEALRDGLREVLA